MFSLYLFLSCTSIIKVSMFLQQILDEEEFKGEDFHLFQVAGQKCLEEGYTAEVLEVIQNEKNRAIVKIMGWNLLGPLTRCILKHKEGDVKREHCLKMLDKLTEVSHGVFPDRTLGHFLH
uniref:Uncharacterized protein n=1 Tax=Varanus komodoensis TaxID=61221 RepID=A0A8D2J8I0_VARKO